MKKEFFVVLKKNLLSRIKVFLDGYPRCYFFLIRKWRSGGWNQAWLVCEETDVVVEAYPRSASSFAFHALRESQEPPLRFATHTHCSSQLHLASKLGKPAMVIIRQPFDAVISELVYSRARFRIDYGYGRSHLWSWEIKHQFNRWCKFYERLMPYRAHYFIIDFKEVIHDFEVVSKKFSDFSNHVCSPWNTKKAPKELLFAESEHVGPSFDRDQDKKIVSALVTKVLSEEDRLRAERIYEAFKAP